MAQFDEFRDQCNEAVFTSFIPRPPSALVVSGKMAAVKFTCSF